MGLLNLFNKSETLIAVDIGSSIMKVVELDVTGATPKLVNIARAPMRDEYFANNLVSKPDIIAEKLGALIESNGIGEHRIVTAMPGPSVFTKKIKMPKLSPSELAANVMLEAGSFIPHDINAVKIDYHVVQELGKNQIEVLVVAAKNEIVESFLDCVGLAGFDVAVVDVDYFALQNCFELAYPTYKKNTVALINMGARYSSINICKDGQSLFTGDIAVGGKIFSDALAEGLGLSFEEAEELKCNLNEKHPQYETARDIIDRKVEYTASEFNRQLSLFWNASGAEDGIDTIMLAGGGALVPGLHDELKEKTGIDCESIDVLKGIDCAEGFDSSYLKDMAPYMAIAVGMGVRQPGDKELPDYLL